jgi:hypothetical protein
MIRRFFPLPVLLEIIDLIINVAGAVFLDLILFTVGENCLASFPSDLIPILSFLWRLKAIAALTEDFD